MPSPLLGRYFEAGIWLPVEARAEDMERALQHEIVWAFRGGYGAVHLVPALLQAQAAGQPLLIGYSDITVLHACWRVRGSGPAIYGTLSEEHDRCVPGGELDGIPEGRGIRLFVGD